MAGVEVKSPEGEVEELHSHSRGRIRDLLSLFTGETVVTVGSRGSVRGAECKQLVT